MKMVTFEDIKNMKINPQTCYEWVNEMIMDKDSVLLPAKISMKPAEQIFCNVMPCILGNALDKAESKHTGGVKIVTRYPERTPSLNSMLLLFDAENGEFLALMDANWITAMRTGAVAVHSIALFARSDFKTLAIMGLGNTARSTLLVLAAKYPDKEFYVKLLKYKGQELLFMERFLDYPNLHFICVDNMEQLVKGSEIIISAATYLSEDVCENEYFQEGVLVLPIHTRGFTNCDLFFDKIYADDYGHVNHFKNFGKFRYFAEVCDVVKGKAVGRKDNRERILVYNIGVSMHDINFAAHIYQLLAGNQSIADIDLRAPADKFWI